jgi:hypothetical protein
MAAQAAGHDSGKSPTEFLILVAPEAASGRGRPAAVVESGKNVVRIGESWMVLDDLKGVFVTQATDPDSWLVAWRAGPSNLSPSLSRAADEVAYDFLAVPQAA